MAKPNTMNTVQEIFRILLDQTHANLLKSGLHMKEQHMLQNIDGCQICKNLTVEITSDGDSVVLWDSAIGETVAFPVTVEGFYFSQVKIYKKKFSAMKKPIEEQFPGDAGKLEVVQEEIEAIQCIFSVYSEDAKSYFK